MGATPNGMSTQGNFPRTPPSATPYMGTPWEGAVVDPMAPAATNAAVESGGFPLSPTPKPTPVPKQEPGLFSQLGSAIKDYTSNPANMARLAAGFNSMRLTPDAGIARIAEQTIKAQQEQQLLEKKRKEYARSGAAILKSRGYSDKEIDAAMQSPQVMNVLLEDAFKKPAKPSVFEQKVAALMATGKTYAQAVNEAMSSTRQSITVDAGDKSYLGASYKQASENLNQYVQAGRVAQSQNGALTMLQGALEGRMSGPFEQTRSQLTQTAASLGFNVDEDQLSGLQTIDAVAKQIVADELRQNKGPQTDFDAQFASTYLPGLGQTPEANQRIISYMRGRNTLNALLGNMAANVSYDPDGDVQLARRLNQIATKVGPVVRIDAGNNQKVFLTFDEFLQKERAAGYSPQQALENWMELF